MCNAWNHPVDCSCGWGGEGHLGRSPNHPPGRLSSRADHVTLKEFCNAESYTIPNAKCPVCGAKVYFFRSPDNGRVFFDELGPPWPKHLCTSPDGPKRIRVGVGAGPLPFVASSTAWQSERWSPLIVHEIRTVPNAVEWCRIVGIYKGRRCDLFAKSEAVPRHTLFQIRQVGTDEYVVSFFVIGDDMQIISREFVAFPRIPNRSNKSMLANDSDGTMAAALRGIWLRKDHH